MNKWELIALLWTVVVGPLFWISGYDQGMRDAKNWYSGSK